LLEPVEPRGKQRLEVGRDGYVAGLLASHLSGVEADPGPDAELEQSVAHLHGCPTGSEGVVLVYLGDAEDGQDGVADDFSTVPPCASTMPFIRSK
jgi:hypothetical protein